MPLTNMTEPRILNNGSEILAMGANYVGFPLRGPSKSVDIDN